MRENNTDLKIDNLIVNNWNLKISTESFIQSISFYEIFIKADRLNIGLGNLM